MKAKNLLFVALVLFGATALLFTGCTKPTVKPTELPNPMVEKANQAEIKTALGFTFDTLPGNITNVKFFTIDNTLAQADFNLNDQTYTARKAKNTTDDITGVYTKFANAQTLTNKNGAVVIYQYNDGVEGLATWTDGTYNYSLFCPTDFNLTTMQTLVDGMS